MYNLSAATRREVEAKTGIPYKKIISMDAEDINKAVEAKIGKQLRFPKSRDSRFPGRGSIYVALSRFLFRAQIDRDFSRM